MVQKEDERGLSMSKQPIPSYSCAAHFWPFSSSSFWPWLRSYWWSWPCLQFAMVAAQQETAFLRSRMTQHVWHGSLSAWVFNVEDQRKNRDYKMIWFVSKPYRMTRNNIWLFAPIEVSLQKGMVSLKLLQNDLQRTLNQLLQGQHWFHERPHKSQTDKRHKNTISYNIKQPY